jgi:hypothetical protein
MYGQHLCNEYIKGVDAFIDFMKKDMLDNIRENICCPYKHCKDEKRYHTDDVLRSHLMKHEFMEDYRCWNKHGEEGLNEAEMRYSYLEREVPIGVKEDHDNDVNEPDILGFTDDKIEFQVHNIEEMVHNVERHGDDDQHSNGEPALSVESIDSIIEKTAVMMRTATETEEKAGLKRCFVTFLSFPV